MLKLYISEDIIKEIEVNNAKKNTVLRSFVNLFS
jgi:hypothetical protein